MAEHEITRLVSLTAAVAARMGIEETSDPELLELTQHVRPEKVLAEIKDSETRYSEQ
jgi:hypothetical protein